MWCRIVNCFQANWALAYFNCLIKANHGESLFKKCIQENSVYRDPEGDHEKQNKIKFWTFVWNGYTWNKLNMENAIFFHMLSKFNSIRIQ